MYKEEPVQILDWKEQVLRTKTISIVKVLWCNHEVEEASWEAEQDMKNRYPHLFVEPSCVLPCYSIGAEVIMFPIQKAKDHGRHTK